MDNKTRRTKMKGQTTTLNDSLIQLNRSGEKNAPSHDSQSKSRLFV